jgi:hypothetical protein
MFFGLASISVVLSLPENVKIVSYSYYIDNQGFLDVVGEVQNVGPNTLTSVILTGQVLASDQTVQADSYTTTGIDQFTIKYLDPGQKAPFYMNFYQPNNPQGGSWYGADISGVKLIVAVANETTSYQYPDLTIPSSTHSIGTNSNGATADYGVYWVNGNVKNTGSQTAQNITVFGTFYNTTGGVVAVGYSNQIGSLEASGTASFKLGAFDLNQTLVPADQKIDHYSLLINALGPILQRTGPLATPYPTSSGTSTQNPTNSPSSSQSNSPSTPGSVENNNLTNFLNPSLIAIIVVIIIVVVLGVIVGLKKRKPEETKEVTNKKVTHRKKLPKRLR